MAFAPPTSPYKIVLVGAGAVGTAVAELLRRRGHEIVGVASRTTASADRAAALLGSAAIPIDSKVLGTADIVLIGAADVAIPEVANGLAARVRPGAAAVHFAGAFGTALLAPLVDAGASALALHPVQACPDVELAIRRLPGSAWGVTTSPGAEEWATSLVREDLEGSPHVVGEEHRPLWHAAAVVTSNGLAALLASAEEMLHAIGVDDPGSVLAPLAIGTLSNTAETGGGSALTGPAVRGDLETVRRHLDALEGFPELRDAYVVATKLILAAARRAGRTDDQTRAALLALLDDA
ncbi:MAG: DUF2520 domain-containing protein [Actinomycetota bacterium]|nr:DUF2520 domain-containing protein [Actinomycetota bacterium]